MAASVGGTETTQLLMDKGADVTLKDVELRSPLHAATGHFKTMEVLLKVVFFHKKGKQLLTTTIHKSSMGLIKIMLRMR